MFKITNCDLKQIELEATIWDFQRLTTPGFKAKKETMKLILPSLEVIEGHIFVIRGHRVMLDFHLAPLYGVTTKALNQAVTRNKERFPEDFMFLLSASEVNELNRSQFVTGSQKHRDPRFPPRAFTQEGVAMLSGVLRSKRAVQVNIGIMRAFVKMREAMIAHKDLSRRLNDMERKYDKQFRVVFDALRELMEPPAAPPKKQMGFVRERE